MVISIKSHETTLSGAYVADIRCYMECQVSDTSFSVIRVLQMRLDR